LIDEARVHIQTTYRRPLGDKFLRWLIATVMTRPSLVRAGLFVAHLAAPVAFLLPGRLALMAAMGAHVPPQPVKTPARAIIPNARRIALMPGCVQPALAPQIDDAVSRLLARRGIELVPLEGAGCCGSLVHHLGRSEDAKNWARRAIEAFEHAGGERSFGGVLITATGCSAHMKDLTNLFLDDPLWLPRARAFAGTTRDFLDLATPAKSAIARGLRVAWQAPCSLQNGLKLAARGEELLKAAGFDVLTIPEAHLCCGSAGSYSILQPELSGQLRARKLGNIASLGADLIATSYIGCLNHLSGSDAPPVVHLAELLDWAEGGPMPLALAGQGG
jgi:glycolate oxidase iron-sulfur subunit